MAKADPMKYPKAKYHAELPPVLVADPEEENNLGEGWYDHPDLVASGIEKPKRGRPRTTPIVEEGE